ESKRHADAVPHYRKAIEAKPEFFEAHSNLGNALSALKRYDEAIACYRSALAIKPDFPEAHGNLGNALEALRRPNDAVVSYQTALALDAKLHDVHHNLGNVWSMLGEDAKSRAALETAIRLAPRKPEYYRSLAQTKRFTREDAHLAAMEQLARNEGSLSEDDRVALHFALGKACADLGEHERSFGHYRDGNAAKRRELEYDEAAQVACFTRLKAVFTSTLIEQKRSLGHASNVPIFIFGMPRSGTTLVEQVLSSHPQVFGAGEREDLQAAA